MVWEAIKALIRKNDKIPLIPKSNLWAAKQAFTQKMGQIQTYWNQKNQKELIYRYFLKKKYTHIFELKTKIDKNKSKYHCFFSFALGSNSEPKFWTIDF